MNNYDISVFRTLGDSFKKIKGAWISLLGAALFIAVLQFVLVDQPKASIPLTYQDWWSFGSLLIFIFVMLPLRAGLWMLGVQWIETRQVKIRDIFRYWRLRYIGKLSLLIVWFLIRVGLPVLLVGSILIMVAIYKIGYETVMYFLNNPDALWALLVTMHSWWFVVPFMFGVTIFAYLVSPYFFAVPLVLTKTMSVWAAITMAGKAFRKQGLTILLLFFIQIFLMLLWIFFMFFSLAIFTSNANVVGVILKFVSILFVPWYMTLYGMLYHKMFSEVADVRS